MRLHQSWRNYAAQVLLERDVPLVTDWVRSWLVDLHVDFFVEHSAQDAAARRPLFEALFDATIDVYLEALREGYPEAQAREITHIQGTWTFLQHGWGELVDYADEEAIDHIVIGSHGRTGVTRVLLGSVAEKVVRRAPCPVTVVR